MIDLFQRHTTDSVFLRQFSRQRRAELRANLPEAAAAIHAGNSAGPLPEMWPRVRDEIALAQHVHVEPDAHDAVRIVSGHAGAKQ